MSKSQKNLMQRKRTKKNCFFTALLCGLFLMIGNANTAFAAGPIEVDKDVSFTISYQDEENPIQGAKFDLYKVADVDAYAALTLTPEFDSYGISFADINQEDWNQYALTLKGYAQRDSIDAYTTVETDTDGNAQSILKPGLYLVVGSMRTIGTDIYSATPFFAFLPGDNEKENVWDYEVISCPKFEKEENPQDNPDDKRITRKVLKIWNDKGYESKRPEEITVQLLCDGKVYETVTLNRENNWRWSWDNLEKNHDWLVTEKKIDQYSAKVDHSGITFTITNTYTTTEKPAQDPTKPPTKLPQTGQLWWPVLLLTAAGLFFLLIGKLRRRGEGRE